MAFLAPTRSGAVETSAQGAHSILQAGAHNHYVWGEVCDGWRLVDTPGLTVKQERVPPGAGEIAHRHALARQVFVVLSGVATLEFEGGAVSFHEGQSVEIAPNERHRFVNKSAADVVFLTISAPNADADRQDG